MTHGIVNKTQEMPKTQEVSSRCRQTVQGETKQTTTKNKNYAKNAKSVCKHGKGDALVFKTDTADYAES